MNKYNRKLTKDLTYGLNNEIKLQPLFEEHFGIKFIKLNKYNEFDYGSIDEKIYIELKSRSNEKEKYPTTMVGYNKVEKAIQLISEGCDVYFTFAFTDCTCYYKFEDENTEWIQDGGRIDRGRNEIKKYYFIPTSELTNF